MDWEIIWKFSADKYMKNIDTYVQVLFMFTINEVFLGIVNLQHSARKNLDSNYKDRLEKLLGVTVL